MISEDEFKMFIAESEALLYRGEEQVLKFEENPKDSEPIQELYYSFYSLKGYSSNIGLDNVSKLCHRIESFLEKAKHSITSIKRTNEFINLMFEILDVLRSVVDNVKKREIKDIDSLLLNDLKRSFDNFESEFEITFIYPIPSEKADEIITDENNHFYKIFIKLVSTCKFKKVRLFVIFRALNQIGHVCWSNPVPALLEKADFELDFEIYFISKEEREEINHILEEILEIESKNVSIVNQTEFKDVYINYNLKWQEEHKVFKSSELVQESPSEISGETTNSIEREKISEKKPLIDEIKGKKIPKIIFTNSIDFVNNKSIIFVPNAHLLEFIKHDNINVIFSCSKRLTRKKFYLYIVKEGFTFVSENDDFQSFEKFFEIEKGNFTNFNDYLEAIRYGAENLEHFLSLKEKDSNY